MPQEREGQWAASLPRKERAEGCLGIERCFILRERPLTRTLRINLYGSDVSRTCHEPVGVRFSAPSGTSEAMCQSVRLIETRWYHERIPFLVLADGQRVFYITMTM